MIFVLTPWMVPGETMQAEVEDCSTDGVVEGACGHRLTEVHVWVKCRVCKKKEQNLAENE